MQPLPAPPTTFRDIVEADLRRAARLIIKMQDEIDWQFRIATPEGDYHLAITMPDDEPDAVYAVGITPHARHSCLARIARQPRPWAAATFGAVEWLPDDSIDPTIAGLLAHSPRAMTPKLIAALQGLVQRVGFPQYIPNRRSERRVMVAPP